MAFDTGIHTEVPDEGVLRGKQEQVACGCWFTSSGNIEFMMIKYQDEAGEIQSMKNIRVHCSEKKNYCGIPLNRYECSTVKNDISYSFTLLFYPEECRWNLLWN